VSVQLHLFYATQTPAALILRQAKGPLWRLIGWDRATDTLSPGQWMEHDILVDRCALSPDGLHFLYFAVDGQWERPAQGAYTVISLVPNFDALALYPQGDVYGGGYFIDTAHYVVQSPTGTPDLVGKAPGLKRVNSMSGAAMTPRAARGFGKRRTVAAATTPQDYTTEGGKLFTADGKLIADLTQMEAP
jgi:hypothetical protein